MSNVPAQPGRSQPPTGSPTTPGALPPLQVLRPYEGGEASRRRPPWFILILCVAIVAVVTTIGAVVLSASGDKPKTTALPPTTAFVRDVRASATGSLLKTAPDDQMVAFGQGVCSLLASLTPGQ